jgi:putative transposase
MVQKGWHCAYDTHYHIVFPVKYRKALLRPAIEERIKELSKEIEERYEITMEQIGLDQDHIHLLCSFHPKYSVGSVVQKFKSITARELFKTFPELKRELWGGEFWSDGYYVGTVSERGNWKAVERYVRNQGKKPEDIQLRLL